MKVKLTGYSNICAFFCLTLMSGLFSITMPTVQAEEVEEFINKLQLHYKKTQAITAFSMTHNYLYLGHNAAYSALDYQAPSRYTAFKVTEFDLKREYYFENVIHHYPGGRKLDEVHFKNNTDSFRYAKNGLPYGKRIVRQSIGDYQGFRELILANVDFFAVRPLLEETSIAANITMHKDKVSRKTTLIHNLAEDKLIEYVFGESPLRLLSLNNKPAHRIYFYDDYQTTNSITFARSIVQYTHGDMTPTFIKHISRLDMIKEIEPSKLQVPKGFGPIIPKQDRTLTSTKIASNLYLVSDSSAWRNTLFKITGDEIMVFGAPISEALAEQTIELIHAQFPDGKITSVYVTHPHSDHIAGLGAYAKRGITIQADHYSISAIRAYPLFVKNIASFKFQAIKHDQKIKGVSFYVLDNTHAKKQSFAYFNDSGVIYQADFLEIPFDNTIPKNLPSYTKTFIDFVLSKQLKINRIVGHHNNNNIPVEVMNEIYDTHI